MSSSRDQDATEVPIASLIDVVFLLIMFFVVTADLDAESTDTTLKLVKADNIKKDANTRLPAGKIIINIFYKGGDKAEFKVGNQSLNDDEIIPFLKQVYLNAPAKEKELAVIRAEGPVKHKFVDIALRAATESKFSSIKITAEIAAPVQ